MQTQAIIVAVFSLCGVLLGGGLQYVFGRALESRKQLAQQKSQAYVDYFRAIAVIAQSGRSRENLSLAADAKVRICIYGSDGVIRHLSEFEAAGADTGGIKGRTAIVGLLEEMRRDISGVSQAIGGDHVKNILFGKLEND